MSRPESRTFFDRRSSVRSPLHWSPEITDRECGTSLGKYLKDIQKHHPLSEWQATLMRNSIPKDRDSTTVYKLFNYPQGARGFFWPPFTHIVPDGQFGFILAQANPRDDTPSAICDMQVIGPDEEFYYAGSRGVPAKFPHFVGDAVIRQLQVVTNKRPIYQNPSPEMPHTRPFPGILWQRELIEVATMWAGSIGMPRIHILPSEFNTWRHVLKHKPEVLQKNYDRPAEQSGFKREGLHNLYTLNLSDALTKP